MKLGIMQPYFMPYLGYFSLIEATDKWVVFDTPQYIRKGWVNRNRILKKGGGTKYINVPIIKSLSSTPINQIEIAHPENGWRKKIFNGLDYYRENKAPYYDETLELLNSIIQVKCHKLSDFLVNSLRLTCQYIDLPFNFEVFSKMDLDISGVAHSGEWALKISKQLSATQYINPPGGKDIFVKEDFNKSGIELSFLQNDLTRYDQKSTEFIPGLSIVDVLMFNSKERIHQLIKSYTIT